MSEFNVEVVGTAFVMEREQSSRLITGEKALMTMSMNGSDASTLSIRPAEWL